MMRFIMRRVLSYTDWVFENNPKKTSFKTKLWKFCLYLFFRSKNLKLYDYQKYLPKLPLPNLERTISNYLPTVQLILSEENFSRHKVLARDFLQAEGVQLQRSLEKRHTSTENYVSQYWEDYGYLAGCVKIRYFDLNLSLSNTVKPLYT